MSKRIDATLIGNDRSGSSWIKQVVSSHPDIYMLPGRQRHFFKRHWLTRRLSIQKVLTSYQGQRILLARKNAKPDAPLEIAKAFFRENPDMKFLFCVRDPVERTYSSFVSSRVQKEEYGRTDFETDINVDIRKGEPLYLKKSLTKNILGPYLEVFPHENILIFPIESVQEEPRIWFEKIFQFLGISMPDSFSFSEAIVNPRRTLKKSHLPLMTEETKKFILQYAWDDIHWLSDHTKIDFQKRWISHETLSK